MSVYKCIVVDDEPLARKVLEDYIGMLPGLQLMASCKNAGEALNALHSSQVDIIFCDIEMPGINGLQLLGSLNYKPRIIITSAYSEYAISGFNLGVTDYLLKPFALDRFLLAVNRAFGNIGEAHENQREQVVDFMFFKTSNTSEKVYLKNIDYVEAYGNYCRLHLVDKDRKLLVNHKISALETELSPKHFIRVHKSYIVNRDYVSKISASAVYINNAAIPLGESYKSGFLEIIQLKG